MTIKEFHYDFKLKVDKIDSLRHENFLPAEIDWLLNEAIKIIVKQRFGQTNKSQSGFESTQKRIQDLKTLHIKCPTAIQPAVTPTLISTGFYEVPLTALTYNFLFLTRLTAKIAKTNCGTKIATVKEIASDDLSNVLLTNPFYSPSFEWGELPCSFARTNTSLNSKGSIYFYTNGDFTITEIYPEYLKVPDKVSIGGYTYLDGTAASLTECDLPEILHSEIVDIAVTEAARVISDPAFLQLREGKLMINE